MSIASSLFHPLQGNGKTPAAAGDRAGLLSASASTDSQASFSQMLRDTHKPMAAAPAPVVAPPPAMAAPRAPAARSELKTETQRQEAKAANKPQGGSDAVKQPTTPRAPVPTSAKPAEGKAEAAATDDAAPGTEPADASGDKSINKDDHRVEDDEARSIADPKLAPDAVPLTATTAGPQVLALLAKAGVAPDGTSVQTDATAGDGDAPPALATSGRPGHASRAEAGQAAGRAAPDDKSALPATRDFTAELQTASSALPQAFQALKGAGPSRGEGASVEGLLSAGATNPGAAPTSAAAPETPTITLAQPLYDAGFAPELAVRVSLLAADGVQEAQLHLNPAEMGPVAVQIIVDGQQAQVSFHAEQAETRAALEQSLPDLAAALRDSGLTLSGGGVFQQAREQGQAAQQDGQGKERQGVSRLSAGGDSGPALARSAPAARMSRGVLDLYA